jgi:hypothetical protein
MDMTAQEIKDFWRSFCERRKIGQDVIARGDAKIDADPEFWADHTMGELLDALSAEARQ